jgi:glycosyltransferase involved in cell wall biosynthesis
VTALSGEHILLAAEYYPSGGTRTYALQLLDFYARAGATVTLVTTLTDDDPEVRETVDRHGFTRLTFQQVMAMAGFQRAGLPTVWSPTEFSRERAAFRNLAKDIGANRVVTSFGSPGMMLSAAWSLPNPIVIAHTYPHGRRQQVLGSRYLSRLIPKGSRFIAVSEYQARILRDLWRLDARGATVTVVLSTYGEPAENTSQSQPPHLVLTASLIEGYKRPFDWIAVAENVVSRLPAGSVTFRWLGNGTYFAEALATAATSLSPRQIQFLGTSADPEPDYRECRVYLQLSSIENLSLSVIDAQRHGVPAVVTDVGGLPEIIDHEVNGILVPVGDHEAAASAIRRLLSDNEEWASMSVASRRLYDSRHSPRAWEQAMLRLHGATS